ncbi:MAG TPA: hypothetical protein VNW50_03880 [Streptosporangiaceae bacterium]|jgi:hypothetical protein|nr:hypothetical protein [Streptosporangiaceae bacterium]
MVSPAARLLAFVLLLVVMFAGAYTVGARLGPIALTHSDQGSGSTMHMPTGAGAGR